LLGPEDQGIPGLQPWQGFNSELKTDNVEPMHMMTAAIFQSSGGSGFGTFLVPLALMFGIMYLMVILPQQRHRKKTQAMLSALKTGDKVITGSGIYGTISGMDGDSVIMKISSEPQVKIRIARAAIAQVEAPEDAK
jgi:preprotein translocase subunit YajC